MFQPCIAFTKDLPESIFHSFCNRHGGVSKGVYNSLNVSLNVGDDTNHVQQNRENILQKTGFHKLNFMNQVHGNIVAKVNSSDLNSPITADALITHDPNILLAVQTADCLPILVVDRKNSCIAAIHAGWRGLLNNIIENTIATMKENATSHDFVACIGPAISQNSFEVGQDVYDRVDEKTFFKAGNVTNKYLFNFRGLADKILRNLGAQVHHCDDDTYTNKNYFSYRRDNITGRNISLLGMKA